MHFSLILFLFQESLRLAAVWSVASDGQSLALLVCYVIIYFCIKQISTCPICVRSMYDLGTLPYNTPDTLSWGSEAAVLKDWIGSFC